MIMNQKTASTHSLTQPTSRRSFLRRAGGLLGVMALSACTAPPPAPPEPAQQPQAPTLAPASGAATTPVAANSAATYPRTVTDSLGRKVTFNSRPQRVVVDTYSYVLDELLLLGAPPIAYQSSLEEELPVWTREALSKGDIELVNFNGQPYPNPPNFEQLAVLKPDLILVDDYSNGQAKPEDLKNFATYEKIAPVFVVAFTDVTGTRIRMLAEILGLEDKVAEIEASDAKLWASVKPPPKDKTLAVAFGYKGPNGVSAQVYNGGGASELIVMERSGFKIKNYDRPKGERAFEISEENLTLLDADMLWNIAPYPGVDTAKDFEASPIIQSLPVVKEGRYRLLNSDQSQAIQLWTPLATSFLVETLNELVASYKFDTNAP